MNFNVGGGYNGSPHLTPTKESQFEFVSNTVMLDDWLPVAGGDTSSHNYAFVVAN